MSDFIGRLQLELKENAWNMPPEQINIYQGWIEFMIYIKESRVYKEVIYQLNSIIELNTAIQNRFGHLSYKQEYDLLMSNYKDIGVKYSCGCLYYTCEIVTCCFLCPVWPCLPCCYRGDCCEKVLCDAITDVTKYFCAACSPNAGMCYNTKKELGDLGTVIATINMNKTLPPRQQMEEGNSTRT